jgi:hypothetical protein
MVRSSLFTLGKFELWIRDRLAPQFDAARFEELARGASTAARQGNRRLIARVAAPRRPARTLCSKTPRCTGTNRRSVCSRAIPG